MNKLNRLMLILIIIQGIAIIFNGMSIRELQYKILPLKHYTSGEQIDLSKTINLYADYDNTISRFANNFPLFIQDYNSYHIEHCETVGVNTICGAK